MLNIAYIEPQSYIYGPGCRFVIWVQGCSLHCKGCWNTQMWSFKKRNYISIEDLLSQIIKESPSIEGVSFLGGEPLDQFPAVLALSKQIQQRGLSIMLFSGYEYQEILSCEKKEILDQVDILITGRYEAALRTLTHQWIGSTNQQIHFLTDRYQGYEIKDANYMEISIDSMGGISILGFPEEEFLKQEEITPKRVY